MALLTKTLDEHIDFHLQMARLKLWFAWQRSVANPEEELPWILRRRTNLWSLTLHAQRRGPAEDEDFAAPGWQELLGPLLQLAAHLRGAADGHALASRFEEGSLAIFRDTLEGKARLTFAEGPPPANGALGALTYDPPTAEHPQRVAFHISNPLQPASIFDDPAYLPRCLRALMDEAQTRHGAAELQTGTWLNSHPRFLSCFPREYRDQLGPEETEIRWGYGFWGQFVNACGCFNHKLAGQFRASGKLPYWRRTGCCSFAALRCHLPS